MAPKSHKIKRFLTEWLDRPVVGYLAKTWLMPHPQDPSKGICLVCPGSAGCPRGKAFNISEGFTAVTSHAAGAKHKKFFQQTQEDPNHNRSATPHFTMTTLRIFEIDNHFNFRFAQSKQLTIQEAAKNQEAMVSKDADKASKLITGQIIWANTVHKHGLSSEFFTCSAELFPPVQVTIVLKIYPEIFPKSGINFELLS